LATFRFHLFFFVFCLFGPLWTIVSCDTGASSFLLFFLPPCLHFWSRSSPYVLVRPVPVDSFKQSPSLSAGSFFLFFLVVFFLTQSHIGSFSPSLRQVGLPFLTARFPVIFLSPHPRVSLFFFFFVGYWFPALTPLGRPVLCDWRVCFHQDRGERRLFQEVFPPPRGLYLHLRLRIPTR